MAKYKQLTKEEFQDKLGNMIESMQNSSDIRDTEEFITVQEALTTSDANILIPKTIEVVVGNAAQPEYLATNFLRKISQDTRSLEIINFGAVRAFEIGEGQEYPEQTLDMARYGGATTEVKVKKYGLKVKITEEMIEDSQWDVIGMHLEAAGRAMAIKKEEVAFEQFTNHGHVVFDGDNGGKWYNDAEEVVSGPAEGGTTYVPNKSGLAPSGRGFDGSYNATLSAEDFVDMCTSIMAAGFNPSDVVMHPLCFSLFNSNKALMGLMGAAAFGAGVQADLPNKDVSSGDYTLPVRGLQLHFSPYVPFDAANKKFDFFIIDRNNAGVMLQKDEISTEQFKEPARDIRALKIRERYGIGVLNGGLGIAVAKNIRFAKTWPVPERQFAELAFPTDMTNETMDEVKKN